MNEIWFCYTMLFILMCLFSASMSLSAYFVSHRTTYLGIMAFFIAFCLETSLIFLDEYSYLKPDTLAEIVTFPFLHPWIKLAFSTLFIMSVWWVVLEYVERRTWLRIAVPCGACVLVQAAVVVAVPDSRLSQWIFYGVQPLASVNNGAKRPDRLKTLIRASLVDTAAAIAVVSALFILCAVPICTIFCGDEPDLIALAAANTLPLCLLACLGSASNVMSAYFQAVDKVVIATVLGMSRYLLFTVPCIIIMSSFMGITGVWWAQPVADVLCFAFTMVFVVRELRRLGSLRVERTVDSSDLSKEGAVA